MHWSQGRYLHFGHPQTHWDCIDGLLPKRRHVHWRPYHLRMGQRDCSHCFFHVSFRFKRSASAANSFNFRQLLHYLTEGLQLVSRDFASRCSWKRPKYHVLSLFSRCRHRVWDMLWHGLYSWLVVLASSVFTDVNVVLYLPGCASCDA